MEIDGFRGQLVTADHTDSDTARAVWNGAVDRRPRLIARCSGTADVAAAVRFARDHDLEIAVRGGGHNVAGTAVCDDGIVIDLTAMRAVWVDPAGGTARVQGGALWGDVDHETQAHGLATTGGIVSHTGVAGLTLGGGIGFLMRKHGLVVDNLLAAEVVTAEGSIIRASAHEHPDLFWALRGGGGNFGVVTTFQFALHPLGPTVMAGPVFWAADDTTHVLRSYRDFVAEAPDELGTVIRLGTVPPLPVIPEHLHWRPAIAVACCYAGAIDDGERAVRPSASTERHSWTCSHPRRTWPSRAPSTTPSPTGGTTTVRARTSPASPTTSSPSSPITPTPLARPGRTRRSSTWVAPWPESPTTPPPTPDVAWPTT
jgi:FAD/FMN-containing dehydrogenase